MKIEASAKVGDGNDRWLRAVATFAIIPLLSLGIFQAEASDNLTGLATVIDGDTIELSGERIRFHAVDAPESRQECLLGTTYWNCGRQSTLALERLVSSQTVTCRPQGRDRYRRVIAVCFLDDVDVNGWMVRNGWALAYRRYGMDYVSEEEAARAEGKGVWAGQFVAPWDWRRGQRLDASPSE